jgi:NAD(P)-dependent dehydrogenase (short-subunit alcohol dehydrogenase family)
LGIAEAFAREGASLCLAATSEERLREAKKRLEPHGVRVETSALDVSDRQACFDLVEQAAGWFGGLDILVNNAATYIPKPFLEYSFEEFLRVQQVNLYGVFHLMQAAVAHMRDRGYGKVVNIASTAGKWASANQSAYNVAKHGVVALTRCVALEMAPYGITVNAICPGLVETDLLEQFHTDHAEISGTTPDAVHASLLARIPQKRFLDVSECGHLAVYLASAESDGMTGQSILLDGGMLFV